MTTHKTVALNNKTKNQLSLSTVDCILVQGSFECNVISKAQVLETS